MARTIGALFSIRATGSYASAINFGTTRGVSYARKHKTKGAPPDPKTAIQLSNRYYFSNIVVIWQNLGGTIQGLLNSAAQGMPLSGFNFFVKEYVKQNPTDVGNTMLGDNSLGYLTY